MNSIKILGFILLFLGVTIILLSLYSGYQTFSGRVAPPHIFSAPVQQISSTQVGGSPQQLIQGQIQNLVGDQLKNLIPSNTVPTILNLTAWSIFLGLLMLGGSQLAGIGIKLLKP